MAKNDDPSLFDLASDCTVSHLGYWSFFAASLSVGAVSSVMFVLSSSISAAHSAAPTSFC